MRFLLLVLPALCGCPVKGGVPLDSGEPDEGDADADADADGDTDADGDADPAGSYAGAVEASVSSDNWSTLCAGTFDLGVSGAGAAQGWADCDAGHIDFEGALSGQVTGTLFLGAWNVSTDWGPIPVSLDGTVAAGAVSLGFVQDLHWVELDGTMVGTRDE